MNVAKLISILQVLPMDSIVQFSYFVNSYEPPQVDNVRAVMFREVETYEKHPNCNRPNRVILS